MSSAPEIVHSVAALRAQISIWRHSGQKIALVPTMGALHEGHLSLIRLGLAKADKVVTSIFVNPKQFNQANDLAHYPRRQAEDIALVAHAGGQLIFVPEVEEIYPSDFATSVHVAGPGEGLCGATRPGHFDGVATIVAKLLLQCLPDIAIFGEKDYQQLLVIKRLVQDLDIPVTILGAPLIRDQDGLALSSRNMRLSAQDRHIALALPRVLEQTKQAILDHVPVQQTLQIAHEALFRAGFNKIDYIDLRDAQTLTPLTELDRPARLLAAVFVGDIRLIDNMPLGV